ncbi:glycosyl hydrolase family 18 protein [Marinicrinis lubricantis]
MWGWTGSASEDTMKKMAEQAVGLDVISPTWFVLENKEGKFEDTSSKEMVDWFHERGLEVHPLVQNQFDSSLTTAFLANANGQDQFIQSLVDRAASIGADGLNIDFESVNAKDRAAFTEFMRKLTSKAHAKKLEVSIDLMRGSISWNHLTAFDHEQLAKIVDTVIIMAYDQHWSGSTEAGSVSGLQWTEQGIQEFLSYGMSREQLILGMPFYIREWKLDSSGKVLENRALYTSAVSKLLSENEYTAVWDPEFNQYKIQYMKDGYTYVFWLEDQRTLEARLELAKEYRLGGAAAWRLGQEPASFWETIISNK